MTQIRITDISGGTNPINVYISDIYGNNQSLIGTIATGTTVPPTVYYNTVIPSIFNTAPQIMLLLVDANGCQVFKILDCTFGCTFQITIEMESCVVDINIQNSSCVFGVTLADPSCFINSLKVNDPSCSVDSLKISYPNC
jgi:hypothetical protein